MTSPVLVPADLPSEVVAVLTHLKAEPAALARRRERLLLALEGKVEAATGATRALLSGLQAALLSLQPDAAFAPSIAEDFATALEGYLSDPAAAKDPPAIVGDCMRYLRAWTEAVNMGPLLVSAKAAAERRQQAGPTLDGRAPRRERQSMARARR